MANNNMNGNETGIAATTVTPTTDLMLQGKASAKASFPFGSPSSGSIAFAGNCSNSWRKRLSLEADMPNSQAPLLPSVSFDQEELPLRVPEAAIFLGVSPQTVYLWVERKQIPHLRVMGCNIRFLKSELEPFRAQFKQEIGNGKTEEA